MTRYLLRALEIVCNLDSVVCLLYAGAVCWQMSGGYESGYPLSWALPRIILAGAAIYRLSKLAEWAGTAADGMSAKSYAKAATSGLLPRDWRRGA